MVVNETLSNSSKAFAVKVASKRLSVFSFSGLSKGCKGHDTHRFENGGTNQIRKTGKREVVLLQPLPQTLYRGFWSNVASPRIRGAGKVSLRSEYRSVCREAEWTEEAPPCGDTTTCGPISTLSGRDGVESLIYARTCCGPLFSSMKPYSHTMSLSGSRTRADPFHQTPGHVVGMPPSSTWVKIAMQFSQISIFTTFSMRNNFTAIYILLG